MKKNWDIPYSSKGEGCYKLRENWNISDSSEKENVRLMRECGWRVRRKRLVSTLRICVVEAGKGKQVGPQVSSEGKSCIIGDVRSTCAESTRLPSHQKSSERYEERFRQCLRENISSLILSWDRKDLDTILSFAKMGAEPMVFDVPVLVASGKPGRICCCNV